MASRWIEIAGLDCNADYMNQKNVGIYLNGRELFSIKLLSHIVYLFTSRLVFKHLLLITQEAILMLSFYILIALSLSNIDV